jgi:hypothetical protein
MTIQNTRDHLIALHKAIIDTERTNLERLEGRLSGGEMLQRLITDERFGWLRALTELIARFDDPDNDVDPRGELRELLAPGDAPFQREYARLLQESPDVVLAHAALRN